MGLRVVQISQKFTHYNPMNLSLDNQSCRIIGVRISESPLYVNQVVGPVIQTLKYVFLEIWDITADIQLFCDKKIVLWLK